MKITKTKSGSYRTVIALGTDMSTGKRVIKTVTGKTKRELMQKVQDITTQCNDNVVPSDSFYVASESYIRAKKYALSINTAVEYRSRLRTLQAVRPAFCAQKVYSITTKDVESVLDTLSKPHSAVYKKPNAKEASLHQMKGVSPKTLRNYWTFINQVLKYNGINIKTPALPQKKVYVPYVPSDSEIQKLLAIADMEMSICIRLAIYGPMREGEVCALRIEDIRGNMIHVHADIAYLDDGERYRTKETPKSSAGNRTIEMPENLINDILEQGYITHYTPRQILYHFKKLLKKCGLHEFRYHDLRHYGASLQHSKNIPDAYIMKRGGWNSDTVLKNVYRHVLSEQDREMNKIAFMQFEALEKSNNRGNKTQKKQQ